MGFDAADIITRKKLYFCFRYSITAFVIRLLLNLLYLRIIWSKRFEVLWSNFVNRSKIVWSDLQLTLETSFVRRLSENRESVSKGFYSKYLISFRVT